MELKLYATPDEFLADNETYLSRYEASSQLNQGNAAAHAGESCHPELLFGSYWQGGRTVLLFGNAAPWNICLNAPPAGDPVPSQTAAAELGGYLRKERIPIAGVTGQESLCRPFMEAYGGSFRLGSMLDIMVLDTVMDPPPVPGRVRKAEMRDLDTLTRWMCGFIEEATLLESTNPEERREKERQGIEKGSIRVLEAPDGTLLSTARTSRKMAHSVSVSAVYTPPEHRAQGYCQFTVAALCREMLSAGFSSCTLFVNKENPISNRVYKKIGFTILEDSFEYKLV